MVLSRPVILPVRYYVSDRQNAVKPEGGPV